MTKAYKTLYKRTSTGSIQVWSIYFDDNGYWTVTGKDGGKEIISAPTIVTAKSTRNLKEQILSEVESKIRKQIDKKYTEDKGTIDDAEDTLDGYSCQLAHKYVEHKSKIKFPCSSQPKMDGCRLLATKYGFFSRGRKKFTSCQHIWEELKDFFKKDPTAKLDGELYTHEYKNDFEKICQAVKKTAEHATEEDIELQKKVSYHIYDAPRISGLVETDSFKSRQEAIAKAFSKSKHITVVETINNVKNEEELISLKERWIENGYEGCMARNSDAPYEGKRSYNLQKLKDFMDEEFTIIKVNEGNGKLSGHAGSFTFKMKNGKEFDAKMIGSIDRLKYLFENPNVCIGKLATVRFQNYTSDGIPRFPVCKSIRDYE